MSQNLAKAVMNEQRQDIRYTSRDNYTAQLVCRVTQRTLKIRAVDVSRRGMGFMVNEELPMGSQYELIVESHRINIEVAYCVNHLGIDDLYRGGLFARDAAVDLIDIFRKMGFELTPQA